VVVALSFRKHIIRLIFTTAKKNIFAPLPTKYL
jgi:hypothetical protein